jgi:cytochrome c556
MRLHKLFTVVALALALAAGTALAQPEQAKKQAEIKKVAQSSLERFYKAEPKLKGEVAKAPGYAVFTNDALYYTLTKNGLQAGGAVAGTKYWKDKELN